MKFKTIMVFAIVSILTGCGDFLQKDTEKEPVYVSGIAIECLDVNNGVLNCTQPTVFIDEGYRIYVSRFTHNPGADPATPITIHFDMHNVGDTAYVGKVMISEQHTKNPCAAAPCSSAQNTTNDITILPGEVLTFDVPITTVLSGSFGSVTINWFRPDGRYAGMAYVFFTIQ